MKNFLKKLSSGHAGPTVGAKVMSAQHIIDIFLLLFGLFPQVSLAIGCFQVVTKYILAISHHMLNIYLFSYFLSPFDMFLCSSALSFQWRRTLRTSRLIIHHLLLLQPPSVFLKLDDSKSRWEFIGFGTNRFNEDRTNIITFCQIYGLC